MSKKFVILVLFFTGFFGCYRPAIPWKITAYSIVKIEPDEHTRVALNWSGGPDGKPVNITIIYDLRLDGDTYRWEPVSRTEKWKKVQSLDFAEDGNSLVLAADLRTRDIWFWEIDKLPIEFTSNKEIEGDVALAGDLVVFRKKEGKAHNLFSKSINGIEGQRLTNGNSVRWNLKILKTEYGFDVIHNVLNGMNLGISTVSLSEATPKRILDNPGPEPSFDIAKDKMIYSNENKWFLCEGKERPWEGGCKEHSVSSEFNWTGDVFVLDKGVYGGVVASEASPTTSLLYRDTERTLTKNYTGDIKSLKSEGNLLALVLNNPATGDFFRLEIFDDSGIKSLPPLYPPESVD